MSRGDLGEGAATISAQRKEWDEHDAFGGTVVDHCLVLALGEVVMVLDGRDRHDLPGTFDLVNPDLRDADISDLAAVAVLRYRAEALLEWRLGVRSEEHTSELQSRGHLVCRLL